MKVTSHTSLKHRMLGAYFKICREVAKNRNLHYVDLYAGNGEAECDETKLKRWKCPFIVSLLEYAKRGEIKLKCYLNELDSKNERLYDSLMKNVTSYKDFIVSLTKEDANVIYNTLLEKIPKNEWSIFFLDPYKYGDLNWKTIESISKHGCYDSMSKCIRKPELIINLMTCTMQRAFKYDPEGITRALGTEGWKDRITNKTEEKAYEIFSEIFIKKLEDLGYFVNSFCIKQTLPNNNVLYYLVFASSISSANEIITKKYKPYVDRIMKDKWIKENFKYRMITKAKQSGNKLITDFQQKN